MNRFDVSVIMGAFNSEKFLAEAIRSILKQESVSFEFIIVDDGSTDATAEIIRKFHDVRIKLVSNDTNRGLAYSLNRAIELTSGEFIACMDADDIANKKRLKTQVDFLRKRDDVDLCGTFVTNIPFSPVATAKSLLLSPPLSHEDIRATFLWYCPITHPSVMFRRDVFLRNNIRYDESFRRAQDYDLWTRIVDVVNMEILPRRLLKYRVHSGQASAVAACEQSRNARIIRERYLGRLGDFSQKEIEIFQCLSERKPADNKDDFLAYVSILNNLYSLNTEKGVFSSTSFNRQLNRQLLRISAASSHLGTRVWRECRNQILFFDKLDKMAARFLDAIFACGFTV